MNILEHINYIPQCFIILAIIWELQEAVKIIYCLYIYIFYFLLYFNNLLIIYFIRCIDQMLDGIKPLIDEVLANLIRNYYPNWYQKCNSVQYPKKVF